MEKNNSFDEIFDDDLDFDSLKVDTNKNSSSNNDKVFEDFDEDIKLNEKKDDFFSINNNTNNSENNSNKNNKKTGFIIVGAGIALVVLFFALASILGKNKSTYDINDSNNNEKLIDNSDSNVQVVNQPVIIKSSEEDWKELNGTEDIEFSSEPIESIFTITYIKHYAKVSNNEICVKTIIKGSLSGFTGLYEITIPYSKGKYLKIGNTFNVKVAIGEYKGNIVVDDILY